MYGPYMPPWMPWMNPPQGSNPSDIAKEIRKSYKYWKQMAEQETANKEKKKKEEPKPSGPSVGTVFTLLVMFSPIIGSLYGTGVVLAMKMFSEVVSSALK